MVDGEMDVTEAEGLTACFGGSGVEVLRRAEEPVEGDDDELDGVEFPNAVLLVGGIEGCEQHPDDGDVDRVGSRVRVGFLFDGSQVSSEYGM